MRTGSARPASDRSRLHEPSTLAFPGPQLVDGPPPIALSRLTDPNRRAVIRRQIDRDLRILLVDRERLDQLRDDAAVVERLRAASDVDRLDEKVTRIVVLAAQRADERHARDVGRLPE